MKKERVIDQITYKQVPSLIAHELGEGCACFTGRLPYEQMPSDLEKQQLWDLHPKDFPLILIHGKVVPTPRWQQSYGADYHFSGQVNKALPVPHLLSPLLEWVQEAVDHRINGVFVNWYEASLGHYIGAHRDSTKFMSEGSPIVMISFGASRTMRMRKWKGTDRQDVVVSDGTICILPFETNLAWTHEILRRKSDTGRRVSVTMRAFDHGVL